MIDDVQADLHRARSALEAEWTPLVHFAYLQHVLQ
jgi:hypothetical protein